MRNYVNCVINDSMTSESVINAFPREIIGHFPTPVRKISLDEGKAFWVKDDGLCGTIYGGNKVRKLEYLFPQIAQAGKKRLVLQGDAESHTVTACALYGMQNGFVVTAIVFPAKNSSNFDQATKLLRDIGVKVIAAGNMLTTLILARLIAIPTSSYLVPLSATTTVSTLGYVNAAFELGHQMEKGELPRISRIYVSFATGGTVAGLLAGFSLMNLPVKVVAVQTTESIIGNLRSLKRHVASVLKLVGRQGLIENAMGRLETLDTRFLGSGHGDVTPEGKKASSMLEQKGLHLDLAFTAKAMAALLASLDMQAGDDVLFWNTHDQGLGITT